jgi:hypothetical protein
MSKIRLLHCFASLFLIILLSQSWFGIVLAVTVENNPFYGLSNTRINSIENLTNDKIIKVKMEYTTETIDLVSPVFFKITLYYSNTNKVVFHADTDVMISKDDNELFRESSQYSQPFVHTPNGIVLSSFKFPEAGQYLITVKILGINFVPIAPTDANFVADVTNLGDKYGINISV